MNRSEARGIIYSSLSDCYRFPDGRRSRWMAEGVWIGPLQRAFELLAEGGDLLPCWDSLVLEKREGIALDLMRDYRRLLIDPFPENAAPRCGPENTAETGLPGEPVCRTNREADSGGCCRNGCASPDGPRGVPGCIVKEFEFMGMLAGRSAPLAGAEKIRMEEMQMDFFSRFLLPCIPGICERVAQEAHLPFYRSLGELTGRFIHFEKNYLGVTEEGNAG